MKSRKFVFSKFNASLYNTSPKYFNFKAISRNQHLELFSRYFSFYRYLASISNSRLRTKLKPVCIVSGRSRGLINKFCLSRLVFKEYSINGYIFGFKKSQWLMQPQNLFHCLILEF
jgi:ribosomal protein S14